MSYLSVNWQDPVDWASPTNEGLVSWWKTIPHWKGGTKLRDLTGYSHGTLTNKGAGNIVWAGADSRKGGLGSLDYAGTGYVTIPTRANHIFGDGSTDDAFTVMAWTDMDDATSFRTLSRHDGTDTVWFFGTNPADKLLWILYDDSAGVNINTLSDAAITTNEGSWIHTAGTYDGSASESGLFTYINALPVTSTQGTGGGYTAMEPFPNLAIEIGRLAGSAYSDGRIDDVRIFKGALSKGRINEIYVDSMQGDIRGLNMESIVLSRRGMLQRYAAMTGSIGKNRFSEGLTGGMRN